MTQNIFERFQIPEFPQNIPSVTNEDKLESLNYGFEQATVNFFRNNFNKLFDITPNWGAGTDSKAIHRDLTIWDLGSHWNREDSSNISLLETSEDEAGRWEENLFLHTPSWLRTAKLGILENRIPTAVINVINQDKSKRYGFWTIKAATLELGVELGKKPGNETVTATYESRRGIWSIIKSKKQKQKYEHIYGYVPTDKEVSLLHEAAGLIVSTETYLEQL